MRADSPNSVGKYRSMPNPMAKPAVAPRSGPPTRPAVTAMARGTSGATPSTRKSENSAKCRISAVNRKRALRR